MPKLKPQSKSTKGLVDGIKNLVIKNQEVTEIPEDMRYLSGGSLNLGETPTLEEYKLRKSRIDPLGMIYNKIGLLENIDNNKITGRDPRKIFPNAFGLNESNKDAFLSNNTNISEEDKNYFKDLKNKFDNSEEFKAMQDLAKKRGEKIPQSTDTDSFQEYLENMAQQDLNKYMKIYKGISPKAIVGNVLYK